MHLSTTAQIRQYFPTEQLRPYIRYFIISERKQAGEYKVIPSLGPVIGLQYSGELSVLRNDIITKLNSAEITGLSDSYRIFASSANIGTVLIYFNETGLSHFTSQPACELFNLSLSLEDVFAAASVRAVKEELHNAACDEQRICIVERFLIRQLRHNPCGRLVSEAIRMVCHSTGRIRIKDLAKALFTSQSPLEKRFKNMVGASPKKFASIVRFNYIISQMNSKKMLMDLSFENDFYDQPHFSKAFKCYTGEAPEVFRSNLAKTQSFEVREHPVDAPLEHNFGLKAVEHSL